MHIRCEYILQINTVGHVTIFLTQSKGGAFYVQGNSMNMSHCKSLNINFSRIKQPNCMK